MFLTWPEAVSILNRLSSPDVVLKASFIARSGIVAASLVGKPYSITGEQGDVWICIKEKPENYIQFKLNGCLFHYCDPREAPEDVREASIKKYESMLSIGDPATGERLYLFEIKI